MSALLVCVAALAYVAVAAVAWVRIYEWLYRSRRRDFPSLTWDDSDRTFALIWGGFVAACWPISGACFGTAWAAKRASRHAAGIGRLLRRLEARIDGDAS